MGPQSGGTSRELFSFSAVTNVHPVLAAGLVQHHTCNFPALAARASTFDCRIGSLHFPFAFTIIHFQVTGMYVFTRPQ